jgi:LysM domain-containing protein
MIRTSVLAGDVGPWVLPPHAVPGNRRPQSIAVYRRRRLAVAVLLVVLVGLLFAMVLALAAPLHSDAAGTGGAQTIVVGVGDTIWDLARAHVPAGRDVMSYVAEIVVLNDVDATALQPGMVLRLPNS